MVDKEVASLVVALKSEGAQQTKEEVKGVKTSTDEAGDQIKKDTPQMENLSKKWGMAFKVAGAFAAGLFGAVLKGGPATSVLLTNLWQQIGFLGDTILRKTGAWDVLMDISTWVGELNKAVSEGDMTDIIDAFTGMGDEIIYLWTAIEEGDWSDFKDALEDIGENLFSASGYADILKKSLLGLGVTIAVIKGVSLAVMGLRAALGLVAAHPLIFGLGAMVAVLMALNYEWKKMGHNTSIFRSAIEGAKMWVKDYIHFLRTGDIPENWKIIWRKVKGVLNKAATKIKTKIKSLIDKIKEKFKDLKTKLKEKWETIKEDMAEVIDKIKTKFEEAWEEMKDNILGTLDDLKTKIKDKLDTIKGWVTGVYDAIRSAISALQTLLSLRSGGAETRQTGGPVSAGKPYLVGEHGPELFVPRNSGTVKSGTETRHLGGGDQNITIKLELDGRQISEVTRRISKNEIGRLA